MTDFDPAQPHAVYRFWDASDRLLYVGLTVDPGLRWKAHKRRDWWRSVARATLEWFPDRASAERAEREAIRNEDPVHNVRDREQPKIMPAERITYPLAGKVKDDALLTVSEAVAILRPELNISRGAVYGWIKNGRVPAGRTPGGQYMLHPRVVARLITQYETRLAPEPPDPLPDR